VSKTSRIFLIIGAILGAVSVAVGAFGAHGLHDYLEETGRSSTFVTGVTYLWYHTFAILIVGVLSNFKSNKFLQWSGYLFLIGILLFSGSLFLLIATGNTSFGAITPIGGLSFIAGWICLAVGVFRIKH
jgi:uncharacterized membrane protein YgdD (TMEM256/DUF423 family)